MKEVTEAKKEKPKKRVFRKILKIFLYIIGIFFFLAISFTVLMQTHGFRKWFYSSILELVNGSLYGRIELEDLRLDPFSGKIEIDKFLLYAAGDTVAFTESVIFEFKIKPIFSNIINLERIYLKTPRVKILRSGIDSIWNVAKIAKPSYDTTTSPPAKWNILVRKLIIENGEFFFVDSTYTYPKCNHIVYTNMDLKNLKINLKAEIDLSKPSFKADINNLSCIEANSDFNIQLLKFNGLLDTTKISANSFQLITPTSNIKLDAALENINIFGSDAGTEIIDSAYYTVLVNSVAVDMADIRKFAEFQPEITGIYQADIKASGRLNDLNIEKIKVKTGNTDLVFNGFLKDVINPQKFRFYTDFGLSRISRRDLSIIKGIDLSSVPDFGLLNLKALRIDGRLDTIAVFLNSNSGIGAMRGWLGLGIHDEISYSGDLSVNDFNLSKLLKNETFESSINSDIKFTGVGTSTETLELALELNADDSRFTKYYFSNIELTCKIKKQLLIDIDTLNVSMPAKLSKDFPEQSQLNQMISMNGTLNFGNFHFPEYNISTWFSGINLVELLQNQNAPTQLDGFLKLSGSGFKPDSLFFDLAADIAYCQFGDRSLLPVSLTASLNKTEDDRKTFKVSSELFDATLTGSFNISGIIHLLQNQIVHFTDFINLKINAVNPEFLSLTKSRQELKTIGEFSPVSISLQAGIRDVSALNIFLKDAKLFCQADIRMELDITNEKSKFIIDTLNLSALRYESRDFNLSIKPLEIKGNAEMIISDSLPYLSEMNLDIKSIYNIDFNELSITSPSLDMRYKYEKLNFDASSGINNLLDFSGKGSLLFNNDNINLNLDSTRISYQKSLTWNSSAPLVFQVDTTGIEIISFRMKRENAEEINISGKVDNMVAKDLNINIKNFPLTTIKSFLGKEDQKKFKTFSGVIEDLGLNINDSLANPDISINFKTSDFSFYNVKAGYFKGIFRHRNGIVAGNLDLFKKQIKSDYKALNLVVNCFPLDLSLSSGVTERIHSQQPLDISLSGTSIPMVLLSPFIPGLSNLRGYLDSKLDINGYINKELDYSGNIELKKAGFLLDANNINYLADGRVDITTGKISVKQLNLYNLTEDLPAGKAEISGELSLDKLDLKDFSFSMNTKKFLLLSPASVKSMPTLYGDFVISTGSNPLKFSGTLQTPSLSGDVNVVKANLTMPELESSSQLSSSGVTYKKQGNNISVYLENLDSLKPVKDTTISINNAENPEKKENVKAEKNFADQIGYDLYIKIPGSLIITMQMGIFGQIYAEIATKDQTESLHFIKDRLSGQPKLIGAGGLVLKDGSTLKYIKLFNTTGNISFPTGSLDDPGLDLKAVYSGQSYINEVARNFAVTLNITGTKNRPNLRFTYSINGEDAAGDSTLITQNALYLIAFGKTKTELEAGGQGKFDFSELGVSSTSAMASKMATDLLQGTGLIQSADIDFAGGSFDKARLKLTGQLFGNVVWRVGGTVADISNNNEISIDVPLGIVIHPELLNNIILQLTRATSMSQTITRNQKEWEVKLKFGGSW